MLPNIIFIFSILGIVLIVLRHLPEASAKRQAETERGAQPAYNLMQKGLPIQAISTIKVGLTYITKKVWHFILEAKDLRPQAATGYRIKKLFAGRMPHFKHPEPKPLVFHDVKNEQYYLDIIKLQPKNFGNYDALGRFYLEQSNFTDAKDVYLYLTNHEPTHPDYQAKLAQCLFLTREFGKAVEHYQKSLALDSTHPNRYYNLGLALKEAGDKAQAKLAFSRALELEPANVKYQEAVRNI